MGKQSVVIGRYYKEEAKRIVEGKDEVIEEIRWINWMADEDIKRYGIGDEGILKLSQRLNENKSLLMLLLRFNNITNVGLKSLSNVAIFANRVLKLLDISCNDLFGEKDENNEGIIALTEALCVNNVIKTLYLNGTLFGDKEAKIFKKALKLNNSIVTLGLNENQISDIGAEEIAFGISGNNSLTELDLGSNQIGDVGAKAIAISLKANSFAISSLLLSCNDIGSSGAAEITRNVLEYNSSLALLDLSKNKIDSVEFLAQEANSSSPNLHTLNLSGNQIGSKGAKAFGKALRDTSFPFLRTLILNNCEIDNDGAIDLLKSFQLEAETEVSSSGSGGGSNNNLTKLSLEGNGYILPQTESKLSAAIDANNAKHAYFSASNTTLSKIENLKAMAASLTSKKTQITIANVSKEILENLFRCDDYMSKIQKMTITDTAFLNSSVASGDDKHLKLLSSFTTLTDLTLHHCIDNGGNTTMIIDDDSFLFSLPSSLKRLHII